VRPKPKQKGPIVNHIQLAEQLGSIRIITIDARSAAADIILVKQADGKIRRQEAMRNAKAPAISRSAY